MYRPSRRTMIRRTMIASALAAPLTQAAQSPPKPWSAEYQAKKGGVALYMFRKRAAVPKAGQAPLPVLFLVHGSSISSRNSFDLTVPERGEYSVMNTFAQFGFDVWTMDHENYGRSGRTEGNS